MTPSLSTLDANECCNSTDSQQATNSSIFDIKIVGYETHGNTGIFDRNEGNKY